MRVLRAVAAEPATLVPALRAALDGGPAVLPVEVPGEAPPPVPDRVALVVRTSGSSGVPKQVALSADALIASARATEQALAGPGAWVLALPGHYIAGAQVIVRALLAGGAPTALPPGPFSAAGFSAAVAALPQARARYSALVPTQVHRVVEAAERGDRDVLDAVRRLDAVLVGGGRLAPDLAERAAAIGLAAVRTYGASETAGGCVYDGVPLPGVRVRVVDGEVRLAGPTLAEGYLDPVRTAAAFVDGADGHWYRTGDAGDWDGVRLRISGRLDDVIISGGEKVSLGLVEQVVQGMPGLGEAVVVRAPDAEWGEVPVVVTVRDASLERVRQAVGEALGRAAAPRRVLVLPELPVLPSGKPDRVLLTRLAAG